MNRKFSRMISLFLSLVMCFSCVVFADIQEIKCNHIKGEIILELNSDNLGKALLDFAGNKEKDIDMFFYDGPLDFYYQEEQLLEDSKNSFIDLITNELMENKFIKDYALYCYEAGYLEDIDKSILEKELYAELKEDINSDFEEYYASYPYMYKALKDLEYKSVKVVYDVYTYLPEKVNTEIKMTVYILSDDINNNIVVPIHLIVDEEGVLINSDIVLTLYDIISKLELTEVATIEYRNLLAEQLIDIDYFEIKFDDTDIEDYRVLEENKVYFEEFANDILNLFSDLDLNKYVSKGNEIVINNGSFNKLFEEILIYSYKNYDKIYEGVITSITDLYIDVMMATDEFSEYSREEIITMAKESFTVDEDTKLEYELEVKGNIFLLLNALNNYSENEYMKKDLETLFEKVKEIEKNSYIYDYETLIPCYDSEESLTMNCMPYYRYNYDNVEEYIYEDLFNEDIFELFALLNVLQNKTADSYFSSNNNIDLLSGTINFVDELNIVYNDYSIVKLINKYSIDNKDNKVITTDIDRKYDYNKINYMMRTVENIICPIDNIEIMYYNFDSEYYNWCDEIKETHFDNSITNDYGVIYELVNNSFYIDVDYIDSCFNLKLVEKEVNGEKYFVTILNEEEILLGYHTRENNKYLKVRDLEKLGYKVHYEKITDNDNIITISK